MIKDLPEGWTLATIGDLIGPDGVFVDGDWIESKDQDPEGDVRLIQLADIGDGSFLNRSSRYLTIGRAQQLRCTFLSAEDILVARMPDPLGRACIFPSQSQPCVTAVDVCIVRPEESLISRRWLMWAINSPSFRQQVENLQSGSTRKRISRRNLSTIVLPIPPKPEQNRIAEEVDKQISRLETGVVNLRALQANLKRYRIAVLKAACEGRIVLQETVSTGDECVDSSSGLWPIPKGWRWRRAEEVSEFITKGSTPDSRFLRRDDGEIPFIKVQNLTFNGSLDLSINRSFVAESVHASLLKRSIVYPGDVLMNIVGPPLGKVALVPSTYPEWNINQAVVRFRPRAGVNPAFLLLVLQNEGILRWAERSAKATAGQFNLTLEICRQLPIPIPPESEQDRIVAEVERRLSLVESFSHLLQDNLKRAENLRRSILRHAFSGVLVAQDSEDEPAAELLERIRLAKGTAAANQPRRGDRKPAPMIEKPRSRRAAR